MPELIQINNNIIQKYNKLHDVVANYYDIPEEYILKSYGSLKIVAMTYYLPIRITLGSRMAISQMCATILSKTPYLFPFFKLYMSAVNTLYIELYPTHINELLYNINDAVISVKETIKDKNKIRNPIEEPWSYSDHVNHNIQTQIKKNKRAKPYKTNYVTQF